MNKQLKRKEDNLCKKIDEIASILKGTGVRVISWCLDGVLDLDNARVVLETKNGRELAGFRIYVARTRKYTTYTLILYSFRRGLLGINVDRETVELFLDVILHYLKEYELRVVAFFELIDYLVDMLDYWGEDWEYLREKLVDLMEDDYAKLYFHLRARK